MTSPNIAQKSKRTIESDNVESTILVYLRVILVDTVGIVEWVVTNLIEIGTLYSRNGKDLQKRKGYN